MKLLACAECGDIFGLRSKEPRNCECGKSGGQYGPDGDRAVIWGASARLLGLNNRVWPRAAFLGEQLGQFDGDEVLWPYPEDNGKITRLERQP